ncbi:14-3-3 protein [Perkinsela sp. CCAP 1560/4]|nr:14-3-3 protein [Perkinsela sp. CCAP 1560/4]|eukprot:KNH08442.1 14-3-3 protein [Perkinsela sp. CCAP 1560/4]
MTHPENGPQSIPELLFMAKLAEHCERFDEMAKFMKDVIAIKQKEDKTVLLSTEERNLLSVAFKGIIATRRVSWRTIFVMEQKESEGSSVREHVHLLTAYRKVVESEIQEICNDIDMVVREVLLPAVSTDPVSSETAEVRVFYLKMQGDYHRYRAETTAETDNEIYKEKALAAYTQALDIAASHLSATHPVRLGLVLNFSVFYYEILKDTERGVEMAKSAFEEGVSGIESLDEEAYKESSLILHLLRDNLMLWREEPAEEENTAEAKLSRLNLDTKE